LVAQEQVTQSAGGQVGPPGAHVASLFCQHVAPELPNGRSWEDAREDVADLIVRAQSLAEAGYMTLLPQFVPGGEASIAGLLLTTEAVVAEAPEKQPAAAGMPGGMPDMM
jgi:hypothetical protein